MRPWLCMCERQAALGRGLVQASEPTHLRGVYCFGEIYHKTTCANRLKMRHTPSKAGQQPNVFPTSADVPGGGRGENCVQWESLLNVQSTCTRAETKSSSYGASSVPAVVLLVQSSFDGCYISSTKPNLTTQQDERRCFSGNSCCPIPANLEEISLNAS